MKMLLLVTAAVATMTFATAQAQDSSDERTGGKPPGAAAQDPGGQAQERGQKPTPQNPPFKRDEGDIKPPPKGR